MLALLNAWFDYRAADNVALQQDQRLLALVPLLADSVVGGSLGASGAPLLLLAPAVQEFLREGPERAAFALSDLDGFYTFVVGTESGFGVLRDPIACKPAVMAETDRYVAFGSEYRALVDLPGIANARIWEPEPATVYFWERPN